MSKQDFYKRIQVVHHVEREINPDPTWVLRTRQTLLMQVANNMPVAESSWRERWQHIIRPLFPSRLIALIRGPALAIISMISVVTGGSIASVSAAERSVPGDLLYPVKLATEQTRLILAKNSTDKLILKTEFVERRGVEIKTIAQSNRPQKQEQLKEAAETLRRDLDTVKIQLNEVSRNESPVQAAQAAKIVDQKSTELALTLKDVKITVSNEVRLKVAEAEVAAVNTGTKAVQVLIDTQTDPDAKGVVSHAELLHSIQGKVDGFEQNIADAAHRITGSTSTFVGFTTTSTRPSSLMNSTTPPTANNLLRTAHESLEQTKLLLQDNKLVEIRDQLIETIQAIATMEASVATVTTTSQTPSASSTSELSSVLHTSTTESR